MPANQNKACKSWGIVTALIAVGVVSFFMHELGHGVTTVILGGKFHAVYAWPGIQLWPHPGQHFPDTWPGLVGLADMEPNPNWRANSWQAGLVELAGSTSNLIAATLSLVALWLVRPSGWVRYFLTIESAVFIDLLFYTFLPQFGLKHYFFIGGAYPEPLHGAIALGIPAWVFMVFVVVASALLGWWLAQSIWQYVNESHVGSNVSKIGMKKA